MTRWSVASKIFNDRGDDAAEPSRAGRWAALIAIVSTGVLLAGMGLSAYWYMRQIAPLTGEIERLRLEKAKAEQERQLALAQVEQMRINTEAEKARLVAQAKEKSDEAEAARATAEEANRKAAEAERQRLALVQEKAKTKSDEAARVAAAQAELKRAEADLKQKSAEIERQRRAVTSLRDEKLTQTAPEQKELTLRSLAGTWQGTAENKGQNTDGTIVLTEYGTGLVGKCAGLRICDSGEYALAEASIQQNKAVLVFKFIHAIRLELEVASDATTMEGTWLHDDIFGNKHTGAIKFQKN